MGFVCPRCGKDIGINKEWFNDHLTAHIHREQCRPKPMVIVREQNVANLKSIQNAIKSDKIRVWVNSDGEIVFENTKTGNIFTSHPYYTMEGEMYEE